MPPKSQPLNRSPNSLVASARALRLDDQRIRQPKVRDWQNEGYRFFDSLGELKQSLYYAANQVAKAELFVGRIVDRHVEPVTDADATAALDRLRTNGSFTQLLKMLALSLDLVGECYLVGRAEEGESVNGKVISSDNVRWEVRSVAELKVKSNAYYLKEDPDASGDGIKLTDSNSYVARIWNSHPRFAAWPDSPLRGALSVCAEIERIELAIRAVARSRTAGAGILLMPTGLTVGGYDPTKDSEEEGDPFNRELVENMVTPIQDEGSAAAVVPLVIRGDKEELEAVRRIDLSITVEPQLLDLTRAIHRLAQDLNLPVEAMEGKAGLSHWTAWQTSEETFTAHLEPRLQTICDALTVAYLRPNIADRDLIVWYDPSQIIRRPNMGEDADKGLGEIVISEKEWRRVKGFSEDAAPDDEERARRLTMKAGRLDGPTTESILNQLFDIKLEIQSIRNANPPSQRANPAEGEPGQTAPRPSESQPPGPPTQQGPGSPGPPSRAASSRRLFLVSAASVDVGGELLAIDTHLRDRLLASSDSWLHKILERAGTRIASAAQHKADIKRRIQGVPRERAGSVLGRSVVESLNLATDDLLRASFDSFERQVSEWFEGAGDQALTFLPPSDRNHDDLLLDLTISRAEAITWFTAALLSLAHERLYDPSPAAPPFGEWDGSINVPPSLIRELMARAGGDQPEHAGLGLQVGSRPVLGFATGALILAAFASAGSELHGWEWVYGSAPRKREFIPHRDLDHKTFSDWSDPALSNIDNTWLGVNYLYPGDHAGCLCSHKPRLTLPSEQVA